MTDKVAVSLLATEDGFAYDVAIHSEDATIGDYMRSLNQFLSERAAPCFGCDLCCRQRIPLTLPDYYRYCDGNDAEDFLTELAVVVKEGGCLDIRLRQSATESCLFLDEERQCCRHYQRRGLVCQTYICLPQTARSRALRETLINEGEDALLGHLLARGHLTAHAALAAAYPRRPTWEGKTYDEIRLYDVIPDQLWQQLTERA